MATINGYGLELTTAAGFSFEKYKNFIKNHVASLEEKAEKSDAAVWVLKGCKDYLASDDLTNADVCLNSGIATPAALCFLKRVSDFPLTMMQRIMMFQQALLCLRRISHGS